VVTAQKTAFDVVLVEFAASDKIKVIKEVKTLLNLPLKDAKELVEKLPAKLGTALSKKDAEALIEKLKPVGGKIELQ
jgi:large subunit ribosomal protein L7/L12